MREAGAQPGPELGGRFSKLSLSYDEWSVVSLHLPSTFFKTSQLFGTSGLASLTLIVATHVVFRNISPQRSANKSPGCMVLQGTSPLLHEGVVEYS